MNAARLLFHKLIQPDHAHISQQVCAAYFCCLETSLYLSRNTIVMLAWTHLVAFFTQQYFNYRYIKNCIVLCQKVTPTYCMSVFQNPEPRLLVKYYNVA